MDPTRIAIRVAFAYVFLLVMVRLSGKTSVAHGSSTDFVLALVFGDMVDNLVWAEVATSQFVVGVGTLFMVRLLAAIPKVRPVVRTNERSRAAP
jgi:uncharacterized membrane protein YcaP (DUF421 family)